MVCELDRGQHEAVGRAGTDPATDRSSHRPGRGCKRPPTWTSAWPGATSCYKPGTMSYYIAKQTTLDFDAAVARILVLADGSGRDLADEDVVAVLDGRTAYLGAIGAIGPEA